MRKPVSRGYILAFFMGLVLFSIVVQYGLARPTNQLPQIYPFNFARPEWLSLLFFGSLLFLSRRLFLAVVTLYFLMSWLYLPQAVMFGDLAIGTVASLFETNLAESLAFLAHFPLSLYALWLGYLFGFGLFIWLFWQVKTSLRAKIWQRGIAICGLIGSLYMGFQGLINGLLNDTNIAYHYNRPIRIVMGSDFYLARFPARVYHYTRTYFNEQQVLKELNGKPATWQIEQVTPKYQNYVLVIGESVRSDYMSLYGYPINNTPFLNRVKGTIFERYIATAPGTHASLNHTLYRTTPEREIVYTDNLISLLKQAGFKTYWLSNQGSDGEHDTAGSRIGKQADKVHFLQKLHIEEKLDTELLPLFEQALAEQSTQPKFIVLHTMGSHSDFCDRLDSAPKYNLINKEISCYVESIEKTDDFLKQLDMRLRQQGQSYSVIYFSDHGLYQARKEPITNLTLFHGSRYKQNFIVPFVQFSSDDLAQRRIHSPKSAFDFVHGVAEWTGIREKQLADKPSFYADHPSEKIEVFNWQEVIDFDSLEEDPVILPAKEK